MTHATLTIIHEEHAALASLLRAVSLLVDEHRRSATPPDFALLRAVLVYIDEFPERHHHRRESELLFPKLRACAPLARTLLDRLERDHANGERRVRDLQRALLAYEVLGEERRAAFEEALSYYVDAYLAHMDAEERQILPLAQRVLSVDDWAQLDAAFGAHPDPLTGREPAHPYRALFERLRAAMSTTSEFAAVA